MNKITRAMMLLYTGLHAAFSVASTNVINDIKLDDNKLQNVLESMEYLRGFKDTGFSFASEVITVKQDKVVGKHLLDVKISEDGFALVEILEPRNERGRRTLIREKDLWLYLPSSSNVIRIAPLQRVFGSASIADVLNTSFLNGYDVESQRVDDNQILTVSLRSKVRRATYARIDLSYDLEQDRPLESKHFTASGRLLKTIQYKTFKDYDGRAKLEKIAIYDSLRDDAAVWIKMSDYQTSTLPDALFTKSGLKKG